ncbi:MULTISPECIES: gamma-glutamylcyclotransferase [unclassified Roseitalea]|uniref:gamma-glutamylcyclotransferase n=1 Tax=unclassified Roseitalea TaxID=2639107 RepID=UPI00273CF82A|nr:MULTISPECIES: gamma-glutamylcyclotransferase [unclassified Roseitalea]
MDDFWVFGYASLMWRPGFRYVEKRRARLAGYHRSLCIHSYSHRGTPERPGLVMGLDRGGACVGVAFRVAHADRDRVMDYLRARELVTHVYKERLTRVVLSDGQTTRAVAYIVDRSHRQYAGRVSVEEAVERVCGAVGQAGPNEDYVLNTAAHIRELGIRDPWLEAVADGIKLRLA